MSITQQQLQQTLNYNPDTGIFTWANDSKRVKAGTKAGTITNQGYVRIKILDKVYMAHRLAWLYVYGVMPSEQIDHINHDKANNRIENLREATNQQNQFNKPKSKYSKSNYKGISFHKKSNKWLAQININKVNTYLGIFDTEEEAALAYQNKSKEIHKEFAHG